LTYRRIDCSHPRARRSRPHEGDTTMAKLDNPYADPNDHLTGPRLIALSLAVLGAFFVFIYNVSP
jgi:hypothetical protein